MTESPATAVCPFCIVNLRDDQLNSHIQQYHRHTLHPDTADKFTSGAEESGSNASAPPRGTHQTSARSLSRRRSRIRFSRFVLSDPVDDKQKTLTINHQSHPPTNFLSNGAWIPAEDTPKLPVGRVGLPFDERMLRPMLYLDGKRIQENLKKHKRDERRLQKELRRAHKRRRLNAEYDESTMPGLDAEDRTRRRKKDKNRRDRGEHRSDRPYRREMNAVESTAVTASAGNALNTAECVEEEEGESDPYRGLPYHWHLAVHCEPDITDLKFTDIRRIMDPQHTLSRSTPKTAKPPWNTRRRHTKQKANSTLSWDMSPEEERFVHRLTANLERLKKAKRAEYGEDPVVTIAECVATSNDRSFHELDEEQINERIMADLIKYNFVVHPTLPSPSPLPLDPPLSFSAIPSISMDSVPSNVMDPISSNLMVDIPKPPPRPPLPLPPLAFTAKRPKLGKLDGKGLCNELKQKQRVNMDIGGAPTVSKGLDTFSALMLPNLHSTPSSGVDASARNGSQNGKSRNGHSTFNGHSLMQTMAFG